MEKKANLRLFLFSSSAAKLPKGPQGPPGAVLQYDLLSNSQAGINYPWGDHFGAFVPRTIYHPHNNELQIYKPSQAHQDPATREITITAEKHRQSITSARMDTKGVSKIVFVKSFLKVYNYKEAHLDIMTHKEKK